MRRKDKEITDSSIIDEIIRKSDVCRLAIFKVSISELKGKQSGF